MTKAAATLLVAAASVVACGLAPYTAVAREKPVAHIAAQAYTLHTSSGDVSVPLETSVDLQRNHPDITRAVIDTSCAGEAQGPERLDRGKGYFRYLKDRHSQDFHQQLRLVPGVAHVGSRMVESPCGVAAAFDSGTCDTKATRSDLDIVDEPRRP